MKGLAKQETGAWKYLQADILNALAVYDAEVDLDKYTDSHEEFGTAYDKLYEFYMSIRDTASIFFANHDYLNENKYYSEKRIEIINRVRDDYDYEGYRREKNV